MGLIFKHLGYAHIFVLWPPMEFSLDLKWFSSAKWFENPCFKAGNFNNNNHHISIHPFFLVWNLDPSDSLQCQQCFILLEELITGYGNADRCGCMEFVLLITNK